MYSQREISKKFLSLKHMHFIQKDSLKVFISSINLVVAYKGKLKMDNKKNYLVPSPQARNIFLKLLVPKKGRKHVKKL